MKKLNLIKITGAMLAGAIAVTGCGGQDLQTLEDMADEEVEFESAGGKADGYRGSVTWPQNFAPRNYALKIEVYDDGRFYAVIRMRKEGLNALRFLAQDTAGNETTFERSAYVERF